MYVKARIEHNCIGDEFFVADIPFNEIYKRATSIAQEICLKKNMPIKVEKAAHPLMLPPEVREFLNMHADIKEFCVYTVVENTLYLFSPKTGETRSVNISPEIAGKITL